MKEYKYADCVLFYLEGHERWIAFDWRNKRIYEAGEQTSITKLTLKLKALKLKGDGPWAK